MTDDSAPVPAGNSPDQSTPPPPPGGCGPIMPAYVPVATAKKGSKLGAIVGRALVGVVISILLLSILSNFYMSQIIASMTSGPYEREYRASDVDDAQRIVILPIVGQIDEDTAHFVKNAVKLILQAEEKPAGIVLRVDSPGGGVGASDRIYHQITLLQKELDIPIVASMGSLAASGGYYVLASSDTIFAEPTTITGSIGVITYSMTFDKLLENIGITPEVIVATQSQMKDLGSPVRAWTDQDRARIRVILDSAHQRFIQIVYQGRKDHLPHLRQVASLANGDVYTADQAIANKLIDQIGYLDEAIAKAEELAQITDARVTVIHSPVKMSLTNMLGLSDVPVGQSDIMTGLSSLADSGLNADKIRQILADLRRPVVEYRY